MKWVAVGIGAAAFVWGVIWGVPRLIKKTFGSIEPPPAGAPTTEWEDGKQRFEMRRELAERERKSRELLSKHPEDTLAG